jgi:hypothetical protein
MRQLYRQGDVLLIPTDTVPKKTRSVPRENGRLVLAHGEMTGHHHSFAPEIDDVELVTVEGALELYLLVHGTESVPLTHQEHDTIHLAPGTYEVRRQREYEPERVRQVAD